MIIPVAVRHPEVENSRTAAMVRQGFGVATSPLELRQFAFFFSLLSFETRLPVAIS